MDSMVAGSRKGCTRLDCFPYFGSNAAQDGVTAMSFSPKGEPGSAVFVGANAARGSIGSQVASKLSVEHFVTGTLDFFAGVSQTAAEETQSRALTVLEAGFRNANSSVYSFGHKLAAGGRMSASLMAIVVLDGIIAVGKVGGGSVYLCREGEVFPFFENAKKKTAPTSSASLLGSNSLVSVELASVEVEGFDALFAFSKDLSNFEEEELSRLANLQVPAPGADSQSEFLEFLFDEPEQLGFSFSMFFGPDAVFLGQERIVG